VDPPSLERAFEIARPTAVVHAATFGSARDCELDEAGARRVNVDGTAALAEGCARHGARLIALSTDQVFDGERAPVREDAGARPLMAYGRTKLQGEEVVLQRCPGSAVVRVALVCGRAHGPRPSASEALAWALRRGERLRLFTDEFRTPVDPEGVASALAALLRGNGAGLYHLGGPERVSRHELGLRVAHAFGLDASPIDAATQAGFSVGAPRPPDVSLDSGRARRELGYEPRPLDAMIRSGRSEAPPA
jgi:dTDP-4-dehydrorhamnose reductase